MPVSDCFRLRCRCLKFRLSNRRSLKNPKPPTLRLFETFIQSRFKRNGNTGYHAIDEDFTETVVPVAGTFQYQDLAVRSFVVCHIVYQI